MTTNQPRENGIHYLELEGSPYEMGIQHGEGFADEIKTSITKYKERLNTTFGQVEAEKIIDRTLNKTSFKKDIEEYAPHIIEEIRGISDGCKEPFDDLFLLNMYEEVYLAAPKQLGINLKETLIGHGCTSFSCQTNGTRFNGQTMDWSPNLDGEQVMFRFELPEKEIFMLGFFGQVGGIGVNSRGLSVFANTLPQGKIRDHDGIGSQFILRLLLEQNSVTKAIELLNRVPRFYALNYSLADFNRYVHVEASATELEVLEASRERPYLVHANFSLKLKEKNDLPGIYENGEPVPGSAVLNVERYETSMNFFEEKNEALSAEDFEELFSNSPVNMANPSFMTVESALAVYEGNSIKLYASAGNNSGREWNEYSL